MGKKGHVFKVLSCVMAIIAAVLLILALSVALQGGSGFLDLSNFVAILILGVTLVFSVGAAILSLIYKFKSRSK